MNNDISHVSKGKDDANKGTTPHKRAPFHNEAALLVDNRAKANFCAWFSSSKCSQSEGNSCVDREQSSIVGASPLEPSQLETRFWTPWQLHPKNPVEFFENVDDTIIGCLKQKQQCLWLQRWMSWGRCCTGCQLSYILWWFRWGEWGWGVWVTTTYNKRTQELHHPRLWVIEDCNWALPWMQPMKGKVVHSQ